MLYGSQFKILFIFVFLAGVLGTGLLSNDFEKIGHIAFLCTVTLIFTYFVTLCHKKMNFGYLNKHYVTQKAI